MIKIVNGKIVREGSAGGSPQVQRRRCSIQDMQLKEYQQQELLQTVPEVQEETKEVPSWYEVFKQQIVVFGFPVDLFKLCVISIIALFAAGFTGLLISLVAIYLGTLFKPRPVTVEERPVNTGRRLSDGAVLGKSSLRQSQLGASM